MKASEIMSTNLITIQQDKLVKNAATLMTENNISVLPVLDGEKLVGIITESDFVGKSVDVPHAMVSLKQLFNEQFSNADVEDICAKAKEKPLKDVMTKNVKTVKPNSSLNDVVRLMIEAGVKRVPVLDGDKLVGIITRKDVVKAYAEN